MSKLKAFIKSKCEDDSSLAMKLAKLAGYTDRSGFYRFLNDHRKETTDIQSIINIVKEIDPANERVVMGEYIMTLDPNKSAARQALEYLDVNKYYIERNALLDKMKDAHNGKSQEWYKIYSIHSEVQDGNLTYLEAMNKVGSVNTKTPEMNVFKNILLLYPLCSKGEFGLMSEIADLIDVDSLHLTGYVNDSYRCRLLIMSASAAVSQNKLKRARFNAGMALSETKIDRFSVFACLHLGNSYIYTSYEKAKENFFKGLGYANANSEYKREIKRSLAMLENVWDKEENEWLDLDSRDTTDMQEVAFHHIVNKRNDQARSILNQLDERDSSNHELAYNTFLRGLLMNDFNCYCQSVKLFKDTGDKYTLQLPLRSIERLGADKSLVELIAH